MEDGWIERNRLRIRGDSVIVGCRDLNMPNEKKKDERIGLFSFFLFLLFYQVACTKQIGTCVVTEIWRAWD